MPKIEIDEDEYNRLQRTMGTLREIAKKPEAAKLLETAHKMVDPAAPTPTLEREKPLQDALEAVNKTISDFTKQQTEAREKEASEKKLAALQARQEAGWARLKADKSWTDTGLKKVQEIMETKGILDPEDAAVIFLRDNPPPPPAMPGSTGAWNFFETPVQGDDDIKKLIEARGESEPLLRKMTGEALGEIRGAQPRR